MPLRGAGEMSAALSYRAKKAGGNKRGFRMVGGNRRDFPGEIGAAFACFPSISPTECVS
jgi:hypothetical protein